ncbi:MAG: Uma2 family endonuclease [Chloroflexota bacterium]
MTIQLQRRKRMPVVDFLVDTPADAPLDAPLDNTENKRDIEFVTKPEPKDEETIYGWRDVYERDEHGNQQWVRIPLTLEDYLHPQEGDLYMHNTDHNRIAGYVENALRTHIGDRRRRTEVTGSVSYGDVGIDWNIPDEAHMSPDVTIIHNVQNPRRKRGVFNVAEEGTAPSLVVEVTSPSTRHVDFGEKFEKYERREIPYYIIIDYIEHDDDSFLLQLFGYEMTASRYVEMTPNEDGWLWLPPVNAWIHVEGEEVYCYDVEGNYLPDHDELSDELAETSERLAETSEQLTETTVELRQTSEQLAETSGQLAESRAQAEKFANYLRSLGIDPNNLPIDG